MKESSQAWNGLAICFSCHVRHVLQIWKKNTVVNQEHEIYFILSTIGCRDMLKHFLQNKFAKIYIPRNHVNGENFQAEFLYVYPKHGVWAQVQRSSLKLW